MNEEQAVLNFFSQTENLPLGLAVGDQMDRIREQMNTKFWHEFQQRIVAQQASMSDQPRAASWQVQLTEDRNTADCLVGLYCNPRAEQTLYLRPMLEQQYLGNEWRIYFGLMWSAPPSSEQLAIPAVAALRQSLELAGFKNNENFLAWKWSAYYPRGSRFLQRYALQPEKLLDEATAMFSELLIERHPQIAAANAALLAAPRSISISLDQLRSKQRV